MLSDFHHFQRVLRETQTQLSLRQSMYVGVCGQRSLSAHMQVHKHMHMSALSIHFGCQSVLQDISFVSV